SRLSSRAAPTHNSHSARCLAWRQTSRDFVPWRFLDAGRLSARRRSSLPASKNLHKRRHSELRVPPSRPIVDIDEFAVGPLRTLMSISKRFLEIAHLLAVLHYNRTVDHITGKSPVLAIPLQNPFQLPRPLRFHAKLVPELADRWTDRCERADEH